MKEAVRVAKATVRNCIIGCCTETIDSQKKGGCREVLTYCVTKIIRYTDIKKSTKRQ